METQRRSNSVRQLFMQSLKWRREASRENNSPNVALLALFCHSGSPVILSMTVIQEWLGDNRGAERALQKESG